MKRVKWKFQFKAEEVKTAAEAKAKFHTDRHTWWVTKKDEVMNEIKTSGISIDESIVDELGKSGYAGYQTLNVRAQNGGPQVRIDQNLVQRLNESHSKIAEHKEKVKAYTSWVEVLTAGGTQLLTLDHEDYLFFYGR